MAAYTLGLVLQSKGVQLDDVQRAMCALEPACAAACAARPDRATTVLPRLLQEIKVAGVKQIENPVGQHHPPPRLALAFPPGDRGTQDSQFGVVEVHVMASLTIPSRL